MFMESLGWGVLSGSLKNHSAWNVLSVSPSSSMAVATEKERFLGQHVTQNCFRLPSSHLALYQGNSGRKGSYFSDCAEVFSLGEYLKTTHKFTCNALVNWVNFQTLLWVFKDTVFKKRLDNALTHGVNWGVVICRDRSWTWSLWVPYNSGHSMILWAACHWLCLYEEFLHSLPQFSHVQIRNLLPGWVSNKMGENLVGFLGSESSN